MREIVLDTETTGLEPEQGHRIVEIGCIEIIDGKPTGQQLHRYLDPEREVPEEARLIHGLDTERLRGEPRFQDIADELMRFLGEATLVIHNAEFDLGFLNMELERLGRAPLSSERVVDTLALARRELPKPGYGGAYNLDALCKHYGFTKESRGLHGALLDADLLVKVYQRLSGYGEQMGFGMAAGVGGDLAAASRALETGEAAARPKELPSRLGEEEIAAHREFVLGLGGKQRTLWEY